MITIPTKKSITPELRPYQMAGVNEIRSAFAAGHRKVCYVLPTGGGKTVLFSNMVDASYRKGNRVLVLVHRTELIKQVSAALPCEHGIIKSGMDSGAQLPVQVASVQSLARRSGKYDPFDFIVPDECHHVVAGSWETVLKQNPHAWVLGVTATPCRLDGRGLSTAFDHMVLGPSKLWLIENGFLVRSAVICPDPVDMKGVQVSKGDYVPAQVLERIDKPAIYGSAIKQWRKWADGKLTAAFCVTVEHSKRTSEEFNNAGIPSAHLDGSTPADIREQVLRDWEAGRYLVVCSCNLFSEGFDLPAIECVLLLRPTKSKSLFLQMCGRGNRLAAGKDKAIILDHVGNVYTHDHPDKDQEWSLSAQKPKQKPPVLKTCPECYAVYYPVKECPVCGMVDGLFSNGEREELKVVSDAELIEFAGGAVPASDIKTMPFKEAIRKAKTRADLQAIAKARGYKPGWVRQQIQLRPRFQESAE